MDICLISMNLFMFGGIQRVLPGLLNRLSVNNKITVIMPYAETDPNIFGLSDRIKIVNLNDFPHFTKNSVTGLLALTMWKINKNTGIFDKSAFNRLTQEYMFSKKQRKALVEYISKNCFDIVIGVSAYYALLVAIIADKIDAKTIGWQHNTYDSYFMVKGRNTFGTESLYKSVARKLDCMMTLTDADKDRFQSELNVPCFTLYNPVSFHNLAVSCSPARPLIFVGRLYRHQKGLDYLIEIMKQIVVMKPKQKIVVVGDGNDREWFEEEIKRQKLEDNIELVGMQSDVSMFYRAASVFVHTSRFEGFGVVIVEAMAHGLPVVAFHNNGPDEILTEGKEGYLVDQYDTTDFAKKVCSILDDKEVYKSMSEAAKKRAEDFSEDRVSQRFLEILEWTTNK